MDRNELKSRRHLALWFGIAIVCVLWNLPIIPVRGQGEMSVSNYFNPHIPGPIGDTTASTGAFTTMTTGTAPSCSPGSGGVWCATEGTGPTAASTVDQLFADSTKHSFRTEINGGTAGMVIISPPGAIRSTGLTGSVSTATLCAASAGACNQAGTYHVHIAMYQSGSACSANTTNGVLFLLTWTDGNGTAHSAQTLPIISNAGTAAFAANAKMAWGATTLGAWASGDINIDTNGTVIQYATTYQSCATGTATYALSAVVTRLQ